MDGCRKLLAVKLNKKVLLPGLELGDKSFFVSLPDLGLPNQPFTYWEAQTFIDQGSKRHLAKGAPPPFLGMD